MMVHLDRRAKDWLQTVAEDEKCAWCKYPYSAIYRDRLCRHCYKIKTELKRLHCDVQACKAQRSGHRFVVPVMLDLHYKTALEMAELAQAEGRAYGGIHQQEVTPLRLEHEFRFLSQRLLREDLYKHSADLFGLFTPTQRKYLFHILSRMGRKIMRRKCRLMATSSIIALSTEQVLNERFHGTYRVENDPTINGKRAARTAKS